MARPSFYATLRKIHLWISVVTGIPLFIVCVTGALLAFSSEIEQALEPESYKVSVPSDAQLRSFGELVADVERQKPGATIWSMSVMEEKDAVWRLWLSGGQGVVNLDPYTGNIVKAYHPHDTAMGTVVSLHRWLAVGGPARKWVRHLVSVVTLFLIVQVLLGLWIWVSAPEPMKRIVPEFRKGARLAVLRLHNLFGVLTAGFVILIAFTGISLWWHDGTRAVVEIVTASNVEAPPRPAGSLAPVTDIDAAIALGRTAAPDLALLSIRPPSRPGDPVVVRLGHHQEGGAMQVWVGDSPLRILDTFDPSQSSAATVFWHLRASLHSGHFGGTAVRILWAIFSLAPVAFLISGLWLYLARGGLRRPQPA